MGKFDKSQGQQGQEVQAHYNELNAKEQKVVQVLAAVRGTLTIAEMVEACGWKSLSTASGEDETNKGKVRGNSWVRNSLRRLVRATWVEHGETVGDGTYKLTSKARSRLRRLVKKEAKTETAAASETAAA